MRFPARTAVNPKSVLAILIIPFPHHLDQIADTPTMHFASLILGFLATGYDIHKLSKNASMNTKPGAALLQEHQRIAVWETPRARSTTTQATPRPAAVDGARS